MQTAIRVALSAAADPRGDTLNADAAHVMSEAEWTVRHAVEADGSKLGSLLRSSFFTTPATGRAAYFRDEAQARSFATYLVENLIVLVAEAANEELVACVFAETCEGAAGFGGCTAKGWHMQGISAALRDELLSLLPPNTSLRAITEPTNFAAINAVMPSASGGHPRTCIMRMEGTPPEVECPADHRVQVIEQDEISECCDFETKVTGLCRREALGRSIRAGLRPMSVRKGRRLVAFSSTGLRHVGLRYLVANDVDALRALLSEAHSLPWLTLHVDACTPTFTLLHRLGLRPTMTFLYWATDPYQPASGIYMPSLLF